MADSTGNALVDVLNSGIGAFLEYTKITSGVDQTKVANTVQQPSNPNATIAPIVVTVPQTTEQNPAQPMNLSNKVNLAGFNLPIWGAGLMVFGAVYYFTKKGK